MQLGFVLLETGQVSKRNQMNIISKNFFDICVSTISFYLCGYAFSTDAKGGMIGTKSFFADNFNNEDYLDWFYKYSLCSTSITIVSGSLAERTFVDTYIIYAVLMTTIIYPVASSWILGDGWLKQIGFHDAAGAGYIHMLGGVGGLVGTVLLGPRQSIFDKATVDKLVKAANMKKRNKNTMKGNSKNYDPSNIGKDEGKEQYEKSKVSSESSKNSLTYEQATWNSEQNKDFIKKGNETLINFYDSTEETPIRLRILLFR